MKTKLLTIISISLLFTGISFGAPKKGTMKDPRDGKTYKTVKIGKQVWMAENMNYDIKHSYCYDAVPGYCEEYGRLYTWEAALNVCPEGWHLPTNEEFETLKSNVGGDEYSAKLLKSATGWREGNGIDKYGFNAIPAGHYRNNTFGSAGTLAYFWSATEDYESVAYEFVLDGYNKSAYLIRNAKVSANSVRCLRD